MKPIKIDAEFASLIPKLTPEEYDHLEKNLLQEGCRDALVLWDGHILLDGHNRYEICNKHLIPFQTNSKSFEGRKQAREWIIRNQMGRRNLSDYEKARLALMLKPAVEAKAKEKEITHTKQGYQKSDNPPTTTLNELAKIAGVSHDTIHKVEVIEKKATPEQKEQLQHQEKSINKVYREIKAEQTNEPAKKEKKIRGKIKLDLEAASDARAFATMAISQLERIRDDDPNREKELTRVGSWIQTYNKGAASIQGKMESGSSEGMENDSDNLFNLKNRWKHTCKRDRKRFLSWLT